MEKYFFGIEENGNPPKMTVAFDPTDVANDLWGCSSIHVYDENYKEVAVYSWDSRLRRYQRFTI